jgi:hypothetical protein
MKWLAVGGVTLFALVVTSPSIPAAPYPLVYKAPPPQSVRDDSPRHLPNPPKENDLFRQFLEWLKTQPR